MLLTQSRRDQVLDKAEKDLHGFTEAFGGSDELKSWNDARAELYDLDHSFGPMMSFSAFLDCLFTWIEQKFEAGLIKAPANTRQRETIFEWAHGMGRVHPSAKAAFFLRDLDKFLQGFSNSEEGIPESHVPMRLMDFGHWLAQRAKVSLHFVNRKQESLREFVSWLYYYKPLAAGFPEKLHLVYDDEKVRATQIPGGTRRSAFHAHQILEKVFLHEIAHLNLHLEHFRRGGYGFTSFPGHEAEAWMYCLHLRCCVVGIRARIDRYLGRPDGQWVA